MHCFHTFTLCVCDCFLVGLQNDHQQAQASWMQRMITSLFSDSTLFNTREGRAGKVHNFMLGLNLNTNIPFSPFSEILTQNGSEEEVDAVTGIKLVWPKKKNLWNSSCQKVAKA